MKKATQNTHKKTTNNEHRTHTLVLWWQIYYQPYLCWWKVFLRCHRRQRPRSDLWYDGSANPQHQSLCPDRNPLWQIQCHHRHSFTQDVAKGGLQPNPGKTSATAERERLWWHSCSHWHNGKILSRMYHRWQEHNQGARNGLQQNILCSLCTYAESKSKERANHLEHHQKEITMRKSLSSIIPLVFLVAMIASMVCGCTRTIYTPVEKVVNENDSTTINSTLTKAQFQQLLTTLKSNTNSRDTIIVRDSTIIVINQEGDVVSKERFRDTNKSHYQEELVERLQQKYDSIFNAQREEYNAIINRLEQTPVVVEMPLTKWQQFRQDVGSVALGIGFAAIIFIIVWLIRKLKRK